ncbi:hypothetical protein C6497_01545 [Candidatus Poribacteria bacterium]|nr:MAG: hypothetical protein C6497_01545 [Candidatus Poribacteria bacterium]
MNKINQNLIKIEKWVDVNSPIPDFDFTGEYLNFAIEIMKRGLYLLKAGISLTPNANTANKRYTKNRAIIVGHMVRITKLYEGSLMHVSNHQQELVHIFSRLIFETAIRMEYLITSKAKKESFHSFILASYRPEKEMLQDIENKDKQQVPNQEWIRSVILSWLKKDGITEKELLDNTIWRVDDKDLQDLINALEIDTYYFYEIVTASHHLHGDWLDMGYYHLRQDGRYFTPDLSFTEPDPKTACSITRVCLDSLLKYLKWNKSDPKNKINPIVEKLLELNILLDAAFDDSFDE